ncbi:Uncharacterised protein [Mycobacterium tuberculosis]|nr:Uncharacterised protein [Mycobacterium tuberculosis]
MQLAHAADDGLAGLGIQVHLEGRILFGELLDRQTQLLLVALGLRLDGHLDHRVGEGHRLQHDLLVRVAQGVTGGGVLETDHRVDVTGTSPIDRVLLVGVHLEQLAQPFFLALGGIDDLATRLDGARVHPDVGELAEERVSSDLERQGRKGLVGGRLAHHLLVLLGGRVPDRRRNVQRRRQVVDDGIQHRLHALVLERAAAQHRVDLAGDCQLADRALDLVDGELLTAQVLLQQVLVGLGDHLEQLGPVLLSLLGQVGRYFHGVVGFAEFRLAAPHLGVHLHQVDDAFEVGLRTDGKLNGHGVGPKPLPHRANREVEVRTDLVHLVDEADSGDIVFVGLPPHLFGLRFDTLFAVENRDRAVEHAQIALHLDGEIHMPWRVDDIQLVVFPERGRGRRGDGDAALLFLFHPVHGGCAVVHLTNLVVDTGVVQDALGGCGLAGIDVRHDAEVADPTQVGQHVLLCHRSLPTLSVAS